MSRLWAGLIALTAASRLSPMATAERVEPASPHPQARAYTLVSRGDRAWGPGGQERPQSAARCVGQPGTSRTESLLTTRYRTRSSPAETKAGRQMRRGCGRRDERAGDAISNRHQAIQHRSSKLGSSRCRGRLRALRENVWLCLSSRAPSGAGRSPYHSEPSIEAPNSSTLSRRLKQKPPQTHDIQPHPARRRYLPDSVTDVSDVGRVDTKLTLERRKASPRSDTPRQPRTLGLTLVTVPERPQLRVRSGV